MNIRRLTLTRREDGKVYLDRWGFETRFGGIYLHKMTAPDPGLDVHNHPWRFASLILRGGYGEIVKRPHGRPYSSWRAGSLHRFPLEWAHRIVRLRRVPTWTLVFRGPRVREWGFFTPFGYVAEHEYVNRGLDADNAPKKAA